MKIIFKHIPKTGGLSIKEILPDNALFLGHDIYSVNYKHLVNHIEPYLQKFVFSFVRNPLDRVVSAFFYLNAEGNNQRDIDDYETFIKKYNGNFTEFVENEFPYVMNQIHFTPQHHWIYSNHINLCNYVGKIETLETDIEKLSKIIDFKPMKGPGIGIPWQNSSIHNNYKEYYTPATKKIIYEHYKKDFELFNYDPF